MIALDTNILVQLITNDTLEQADRAENLIKSSKVFVPLTVLLELEWVLRSRMGFRREDVLAALIGVASIPTVTLEQSSRVLRAIDSAGRGLDFADALHLAASTECEAVATFDRRFAKRAQRLRMSPPVFSP